VDELPEVASAIASLSSTAEGSKDTACGVAGGWGLLLPLPVRRSRRIPARGVPGGADMVVEAMVEVVVVEVAIVVRIESGGLAIEAVAGG
jgi:hypothetical protein